MRLKVTHTSLYRYQPAVETAQHFLHLKPRDMPCQRLESHHLSIAPEPTELFESMDFYQNSTHYLALLTQHAQLSITSESVLSTWSYGQPQSPYTQLNLRWGNTGEASPVQSQSQTQIQSPIPMQMQGFGRNTFDTTVMGSPDKNEQLNAWSPPGQMQSSALSPPSAIMAGSWSTLETPPLIKHWFEASAQVAREHYEYNAGKHFDEASDFLFDSPHIPRLEVFAQYARRALGSHTSLLAGLTHLMELIHQEFAYQSKSTEVNTPLIDIFESRKGVCQDFAHIMVACCRSLGLAARYVSGYILTYPAPGQVRLIGSDASHAWASVYLPPSRESKGSTGVWFDFDPTNNRCGVYSPGEDYITTAWGRDYSDVSPVRGVIQGGNDHLLDVAVTVEPLA